MSLSPVSPKTDRIASHVAVVTGARRGIGRAIALALARDGYAIVVNDQELDGNCEWTVSAIRDLGAAVLAVQADVSDAQAVHRLLEQTVTHFGRLDVWVNNAAIGGRDRFLDVAEASWDRILAVDLKAPFFCSQVAASQMIAQGAGGSIVNISSVHSVRTWPGRSPYAAAKAGLERLTASMAYELGPYGIRVNAVAPGYVDTRSAQGAGPSIGQPDYAERVVPRTPLRRLGLPEDIANAVAFLVSANASFITGECLTVDGGLMTGGTPEDAS